MLSFMMDQIKMIMLVILIRIMKTKFVRYIVASVLCL